MPDFKLDFTGIGVAKAGTSWIAQCLAEHPSVCLARSKETNFFLSEHICDGLWGRSSYYTSGRRHRGLEWYEGLFTHHQPGQLRGEYSNAYLSDPECADLLHAHNPDMKLLCSFRNPTDGAYAAYYELSRYQPLPDTFEEALDRYPQLLEYGRYRHHLQPFLDRFPREQVRLMLFDDIGRDPAAFFQGVCAFLGIDPDASPRSMGERVRPRTVLRSRRLRDLRCALSVFMARNAATRKVRSVLVRLGVARLVGALSRLNEKAAPVPPMAPDTRRRLVEYYRRDNEALADLLQRDLSHWNGEVREERRAAAPDPPGAQEPSLP